MSTQLYQLTSPSFALPLSVRVDGTVKTDTIGEVPVLFWPNGRVCWEANLFLQYRIEDGCSTLNRGGTIRQYANDLSPYLRYCFDSRVSFLEVTDPHFCRFILNLQAEPDPHHHELPKRRPNQVRTIASTCLRFMQFLQDHVYPGTHLVGPDGSIRAEKRVYRVKFGRGGAREVEYLEHRLMPLPETPPGRLPISMEAIDKLEAAADKISSSEFLRQRRRTMLLLFQCAGARRYETWAITVKDVRAAEHQVDEDFNNLLRIRCIKKKKGRIEYRFVPVPSGDLQRLNNYIDYNRSLVIANTIRPENDHGLLLVNETTGQPLTANTLSSVEMRDLKAAAGLNDRSCWHAFRHRFITNCLVNLIERHRYSTADQLRQAILSVEDIKAKLAQWTGHAHISSLEPYIHLAFDRIAGFKQTVDLVLAYREVESLIRQMREIWGNLRTLGATKVVQQMEALWKEVQPKLEKAIQTEKLVAQS
jgi:site-specific recombinase XerC